MQYIAINALYSVRGASGRSVVDTPPNDTSPDQLFSAKLINNNNENNNNSVNI